MCSGINFRRGLLLQSTRTTWIHALKMTINALKRILINGRHVLVCNLRKVSEAGGCRLRCAGHSQAFLIQMCIQDFVQKEKGLTNGQPSCSDDSSLPGYYFQYALLSHGQSNWPSYPYSRAMLQRIRTNIYI